MLPGGPHVPVAPVGAARRLHSLRRLLRSLQLLHVTSGRRRGTCGHQGGCQAGGNTFGWAVRPLHGIKYPCTGCNTPAWTEILLPWAVTPLQGLKYPFQGWNTPAHAETLLPRAKIPLNRLKHPITGCNTPAMGHNTSAQAATPTTWTATPLASAVTPLHKLQHPCTD